MPAILAPTGDAAPAASPSETSTPAYRTLELNLISAKDLKSVNLFSRMSVYAVVSLSGDPRMQRRTPPDRENGRNPSWNSSVHIPVLADPDPSGRPSFVLITLRTERLLGHRNVGEVRVPLQELLADAPIDGPKPTQMLSYQVRRVVSGKPKGVLNFSYSLSERIGPPPSPAPAAFVPPALTYTAPEKPKGREEPVMAYPVGATSSAYPVYPPPYGYHHQTMPYGYPPQHHQGYAYHSAPPQHHQGYGYPPAPVGYGYHHPGVMQPKQHRKSRLGMGLGAGVRGHSH